MKFIIFSLLLGGFAICPAQENPSAANHLLKFELQIADTLLSKLDSRQYEAGKKKTQTASNRLYLKNRLDTLAHETFLEEFVAIGIPISPNDVLRDYIKFGMDGTPFAPTLKSAIKNLGKKGYEGENYLAIAVKIDLPALSTNPKGIKPQIEVNLRRFDAEGKVQSRVLEKHKSSEALLPIIYKDNPFLITANPERKTGLLAKQNEVVFDKSKREFIDLLISELQPVLDEAIAKAMGKLE